MRFKVAVGTDYTACHPGNPTTRLTLLYKSGLEETL